MFGECHDIEMTLNCQLVLNRPTNMKKFWVLKSCYNTLSTTAINKITLKDIVDVNKRRDSVKFIKGFAELTKGFQQQLLDSLLHKIMLALVLTKSDMKRVTNIGHNIFIQEISALKSINLTIV